MPRLRAENLASHRDAVHEAIVEAAGAIVAERGPGGLSMSALAQAAGIGRATLYRYFDGVEDVLAAWHHQQVREHLQQLRQAASGGGNAVMRLRRVLSLYAVLAKRPHGAAVTAALHRPKHLHHAQAHVQHLVTGLISEAASAEELRADVPAAELAQFCLSAMEAARHVRSRAGSERLLAVTLDALRPRA